MKHLKRAGFITTAIFVTFFTACGGGGATHTPTLQQISMTPPSANTRTGQAVMFTVSPSGAGFNINASSGAGCGRSGNAVRCEPTLAGVYTVTVEATSGATGSATATLNVTPAVTISITPKTESVPVGETVTFTVTVENAQNKDFYLTPPAGSGCVKSGDNAVICTPTTEGTYDITVTAMADTAKTDTSVLTATPSDMVTIGINPSELSVKLGGTGTFTVTTQRTDFVLSTPTEAGCVRVGAAVTVTCMPTAIGSYEVTVTATADGTKKAAARITAFADSPGINIPGAPPTDTAFSGMNNSGQAIVGLLDYSGKWKACLYDGDNCAPIEPPSDASPNTDVYVFGINDSGEILGLYDKGYFLGNEPLDESPAGAERTYYTGLNNSGELSGDYTDAGGYSRGFVYDRGNNSYTLVEHPAAESAGCNNDFQCGTFLEGLNDNGQAAGYYINADGVSHGFVYDKNAAPPFNTIEHPASQPGYQINMYIAGINASGYVAGYFYDSVGYARGFVKAGDQFIEIEHPDATTVGAGTYITGITDDGQVTGWYDAGRAMQGFLLENIF